MADQVTLDERPTLRVTGVVLDTPDPVALAAFYARLLGWSYRSEASDWVMLTSPDGGAGLSFQREQHYVPPVWPAGPDDPAMMVHPTSRWRTWPPQSAGRSSVARGSPSSSRRSTYGSASTRTGTRSACTWRRPPLPEALPGLRP